MNAPFAIRWPLHCGPQLGRLIGVPGLRMGIVCDEIWVRGDSLDDTLEPLLYRIDEGQFYWIDADGVQLRERASRIPTVRLPQLDWKPLALWFDVELPDAGWPRGRGDDSQRATLHLVPSDEWREPSLLVTTSAAWAEYAQTAPQIRLARWRFAVSDASEVIVQGEPLPPLPGERFQVLANIAVPVGWSWHPAVDAATVRQVFRVAAEDLVLWQSNERCEIVPADGFVVASRSAVRMTLKETEGALPLGFR